MGPTRLVRPSMVKRGDGRILLPGFAGDAQECGCGQSGRHLLKNLELDDFVFDFWLAPGWRKVRICREFWNLQGASWLPFANMVKNVLDKAWAAP